MAHAHRGRLIGMLVVVSVTVLFGIAVFRMSGSRQTGPASLEPSEAPTVVMSTYRVGENHWVVSRDDKAAYLSDLAQVGQDIIMKPHPGGAENSVAYVQILKLSDASPMHAVGFRKDDRILRVNGTVISTMEQAINLIHEVRRSEDLTVQIERGQKLIDYRFEFR